jgi:hypothetical protein
MGDDKGKLLQGTLDVLVLKALQSGPRGWRNEQTMLRSYQQVDAETVRRIVLHLTQRLASR